jgi:hypothetical protein
MNPFVVIILVVLIGIIIITKYTKKPDLKPKEKADEKNPAVVLREIYGIWAFLFYFFFVENYPTTVVNDNINKSDDEKKPRELTVREKIIHDYELQTKNRLQRYVIEGRRKLEKEEEEREKEEKELEKKRKERELEEKKKIEREYEERRMQKKEAQILPQENFLPVNNTPTVSLTTPSKYVSAKDKAQFEQNLRSYLETVKLHQGSEAQEKVMLIF